MQHKINVINKQVYILQEKLYHISFFQSQIKKKFKTNMNDMLTFRCFNLCFLILCLTIFPVYGKLCFARVSFGSLVRSSGLIIYRYIEQICPHIGSYAISTYMLVGPANSLIAHVFCIVYNAMQDLFSSTYITKLLWNHIILHDLYMVVYVYINIPFV